MIDLARALRKDISRRSFIKYSATLAAMLGLSDAFVPKIAAAVEGMANGKQPVIWLHGAECTGCTVSFANSHHPGVAELVLDTLSLQYHETLMAASGHVAEKALEEAMTRFKGKYILVVEGAIPVKDDGIYCRIGGKTFKSMVEEAATNAAYVVAVGTCASFGGIPAADPNPTQCKGVADVIGGTVVNIPGCPAHPDWIVGTIVSILLFNKVPELDKHGRPMPFFGKQIHENCPRRGGYEQGRFVKKFGEELPDIEGCMGAKGCRGPITYADCPHRLWNAGTNFCIAASAPCAGCVEPSFPKLPLYEPIEEVAKFIEESEASQDEGSISTFAASLGGAVAGAAAGAGAVYFAGEKAREKEGVE
ncbi:hydrogenase small subunit [Thermincola potens]|uniref:Hydrogenase (NiFe) small subunit HydA n=1 Tax=Thermincola potens (strain JR) TaxID=635013 RepID=D5XCK5_THEPJ|nr:hydrogenase small subunit [Thermincola potens]ADG81631.1 hydrogenase (NiFe) small subunit HydA [Thermincola potens JR]